jgi:hypothetical protein
MLALPFDLAVVQEDFAYHEALTRDVPNDQIFRGSGPVFRWGYVVTAPLWAPLLVAFNAGLWPLFNGDGLTTIAVNDRLDVERLACDRYDRCGDYLLGGSDCFAAKGFLAVRVRLPSGAAVDVYNTHLESGFEVPLRHEDQDVRRSQLAHLARAIEVHSRDHAVVVAGDFNSDAAGSPYRSFDAVQHFIHAVGLTDTEVWRRTRERWTSKLDHILYRSGPSTKVTLRESAEATSFSYGASDRPLSDHPAVWASFEVAPQGPPLREGDRTSGRSCPSP